MRPIEELQAILNIEYQSIEGSKHKIKLLEGLTNDEIEILKENLPRNNLPVEIEELLRYARGFQFEGIGEIRFDGLGIFGMEDYFPNCVELVGDDAGNFWIIDVNNIGKWLEIYYVCHDPPVIVKHSNCLSEFIRHIDEFGRLGSASNLSIIQEEVVYSIWKETNLIEGVGNNYKFPEVFKRQLPTTYVIADLTNTPLQTGFNWAKYGVEKQVIRFQDKPIWVIEKKAKQGLLAKILGGIRVCLDGKKGA